MKRWLVLFASAALALAGFAAPAAAATWWQPGPVTSWEWQIGSCAYQNNHVVQVYDLDYDGCESVTQAQVAAEVALLHGKGIKVICYVDVGTWENFRPDQAQFATAWLGSNNGWPGEKWLDIRQVNESDTGPAGLTLRQIMDARFAQCQREGFDGVEMDNVDGYANGSGFPLTLAQEETAWETLAGDVHNLGMAVFMKNGVNEDSYLTDLLAQPALSRPDGEIVEQCWQYKECPEVKPFVTAGLPVLNAEYSSKVSQSVTCPKAVAFPMATARFPLSLNGNVTWDCWG